jgi:polysaccharide biosynthesis transport protein
VSSQIIRSDKNWPAAITIGERQFASRPPGSPQTKDDSVLDLSGFLKVISRRRRLILWTAVAFTALAGLACIVMTPKYKAKASIELLKQEQGTLVGSAENGQTQPGATQSEDALNFSLSLQTAVEVLQSNELAVRVIKELNLAETKYFHYEPLIKDADAVRAMSLPFDQSPMKREYVLKKWSKSLKVEAEAGTRVITVTFKHPDPVMAAKIVNQLLTDYVDYRYEVRYAAAQRSAEWLQGRLAAVKAEAEESATRLAQAEKDTGLYGDSDGDHNIIVGRLEQLNTAAADAQGTRAAKEAIYNLARTGDPELVAGLVGGTSQQGAALGTTPPVLLIQLRQQEADLNAQYAQAAAKYGPENPKLIQARNALDAVRQEITAETQKIVGRARQEYMAAVSAELAANKALEDEKRIANNMNEKTAQYGIAKHEADSAQELYQHLLATANETPILAGIRSTDVNIVDAAAPPGLPASPNVPLYLAAGALVGTMFGFAGAFVRDSIDTSLHSPEQVEAITRLPVLGIIPRAEIAGRAKRKKLTKGKTSKGKTTSLIISVENQGEEGAESAICEPNSVVMEAFRSVRTSILLSRPDNPRRVFMVTSPLPGEGKSFASLHLAAALAQNGGSVLLVDADLRRGTLSRNLKMYSRRGLTTLISSTSEENLYHDVEGVPRLSFLPAGATPPNPAEFLGSRKMAQIVNNWRQKFDFVIIDSPPILAVTDPVVLSQMVDGVVVVARFAVSKQQAISRAVSILDAAHAECFGVLVNGMDTRSSEYGFYAYGGYGYGYAGNGDSIEAEADIVAASPEEA